VISREQLAPCQQKRVKRQQTVSSAGCKVLAPNAGFLLASILSDFHLRLVECSYSQSVSVSVPQDKFGDQQKAVVDRLGAPRMMTADCQTSHVHGRPL